MAQWGKILRCFSVILKNLVMVGLVLVTRRKRSAPGTWDEGEVPVLIWLSFLTFAAARNPGKCPRLLWVSSLLLLLLSRFFANLFASLVVFLYIVNRKQLILFLSRLFFFRYKYCILFFLNFLISLVYISRCLPRKEIQIRISKMFPRLFVLCCCCCCLP